MKSQDLKKYELPDTPGVYLFKQGQDIIYVGKATSLKDRIRSYFAGDLVATRGTRFLDFVDRVDALSFISTDSVLEAILLEANLIKKHLPHYNTVDKDDKSYNYVVITAEDYPRVLLIRDHDLSQGFEGDIQPKFVAGPFIQGGSLKEALRIIRKIFPYRDKCLPTSISQKGPKHHRGSRNNSESSSQARRVGNPEIVAGKPCFNSQIGLCPGVCSGAISQKDYKKIVANIILFFKGKKRELIRNLEKEMKEYAKAEEFENASRVKKTIFALNHIQDVALIKSEFLVPNTYNLKPNFRIEAYDIAHMSGKDVVGVMTVVEDGEAKKSDYRKFKIRRRPGVNDTRALGEVLERRLNHIEWPSPNIVVVDGGTAQINTAERIIKNNGVSIPVVSVVKDSRHKAREVMGDKKITLKYKQEILLANSESHRFAIAFHRNVRSRVF